VRLDAVKQNLGIGSLPLFTARERWRAARLCRFYRSGVYQPLFRPALLLWSGNKHMPARMRAMIDYLSEKMKPASGSPALAQRSKTTE
jgi:DNA-binding transcriptional LysR family regulator